MAVKSSKADNIEIISNNNILTTEVPITKLQTMQHLDSYFEGMSYLTLLDSSSNPNGIDKTLKYRLEEDEETLEDFRSSMEYDKYDVKEKIVKGFLSTILLVSDGKLFNIRLNPLNFVYNHSTGLVKGFYRDDDNLAEITDNWIQSVWKLLAYYLVDDTELTVEDFETYSIKEITYYMDEKTKKIFLQLVGLKSIKEMLKSLYTQIDEEDELEALLEYPVWQTSFVKPRNLSTLQGYVPESSSAGESIELEEPVKKNNKKPVKQKKERPVKQKTIERGEKQGGSKLLLGLVIGLLIGVGGFYGANKFLTKEAPVKTESAQTNSDFYTALLGSSLQKYDVATASFDKFYSSASEEEIKNLTDDEKLSVFFTFLLDGQYDKALTYDATEDNAELVIKYLQAKSDGELGKVLPTLSSDLSPISFEKAKLKGDYATMVKLKDKVKYTENEARQNSIAEALVKTDDVDGAVIFADSLNNKDLLNAVKAWGYESIDAKTESNEEKDKEKIALTNKIKESIKKSTNFKEEDLK